MKALLARRGRLEVVVLISSLFRACASLTSEVQAEFKHFGCTALRAPASWTAPVARNAGSSFVVLSLWRFSKGRRQSPHAKAPEDWRSPKPVGPSYDWWAKAALSNSEVIIAQALKNPRNSCENCAGVEFTRNGDHLWLSTQCGLFNARLDTRSKATMRAGIRQNRRYPKCRQSGRSN